MTNRCCPSWCLVAVVVAFFVPTCNGFCHHRHRHRLPHSSMGSKTTCLHGSVRSNVDGDDAYSSTSLAKVETKAIAKFNTGYNKLCKACPTRLQPRVDTLVEMILGLKEKERDEVLLKVSQRLDENRLSTITTSEDVYNFQTHATNTLEQKQLQLQLQPPPPSLSKSNAKHDDDKKKLQHKMDKAKRKLDYNKQGIAKFKRLLEATTQLLSKSPDDELKEDPFQNNFYHEIDELKSMTRPELKMQRLKYKAMVAKHEQKLAKYRVKMYAKSRKLVSQSQ